MCRVRLPSLLPTFSTVSQASTSFVGNTDKNRHKNIAAAKTQNGNAREKRGHRRFLVRFDSCAVLPLSVFPIQATFTPRSEEDDNVCLTNWLPKIQFRTSVITIIRTTTIFPLVKVVDSIPSALQNHRKMCIATNRAVG